MNSLIKNKKTLAMLLTLSLATSQLNAFSFSALFGSLSVSAKQAAKSIITSASKTSITTKTFTLASICLVATLYSIFCTRNKIHDIAVGTFLNQKKLHEKLLFAINNRLELVDSLLFRCTKKTINTPDKNWHSPIFNAYLNGDLDIAEKLKKAGAIGDINTTDKFGKTAGYYANLCTVEKIKIADTNGDINTQDEFGNTPLFYAYAIGAIHQADKLKKLGAIGNINTPNKFGKTPIFYAYKNDDVKTAGKLITLGATGGNINAKDKFGNTAIFYAHLDSDFTTLASLEIFFAEEIDFEDKKIEMWRKIRPILKNYNKNAYEILKLARDVLIDKDARKEYDRVLEIIAK